MVHHELNARVEICPVELVRNVPAESPELPPLLEGGVQEGHGEEDGVPGRLVGVVQDVLADVRVGPLQTGPDALRGLVGVFLANILSLNHYVIIIATVRKLSNLPMTFEGGQWESFY